MKIKPRPCSEKTGRTRNAGRLPQLNKAHRIARMIRLRRNGYNPNDYPMD